MNPFNYEICDLYSYPMHRVLELEFKLDKIKDIQNRITALQVRYQDSPTTLLHLIRLNLDLESDCPDLSQINRALDKLEKASLPNRMRIAYQKALQVHKDKATIIPEENTSTLKAMIGSYQISNHTNPLKVIQLTKLEVDLDSGKENIENGKRRLYSILNMPS